MKTGIYLALGALALVQLAACSAKVEGGSGDPIVFHSGGGDSAFENKVDGPDLTGLWASDCIAKYDGNSYKLTYKIDGQKIQYKKESFKGAGCYGTATKEEKTGEFRFDEYMSNNVYAITYHFDTNGALEVSSENVKKTETALFVSEMYPGEYMVPTTALKPQQGSASPGQGEDPSQVTGVIATTFSEAKYIFCSTQGWASLMDLEGQNLGVVKSGNLNWGVKECNTSKAYGDWSHVSFSLSGTESSFRMNIGNSSYIEPNGQGLNYAWAVLGGNSGSCYFLKNKGTRGVAYDCN